MISRGQRLLARRVTGPFFGSWRGKLDYVNSPLDPFEKANLATGLVGYDPLFDKRYMEREKTQPEASYHYRPHCYIPLDELPKAGRPWILPPPLFEGQTAEFYFYDDATLDGYLNVRALRLNGALVWDVRMTATRHRRMVGTNWSLEK